MATGRLPDPNTAPLTAKGDLYTYSTVPARLAVGSNGDTLVADSSTSTGLRYNPVNTRNLVVNGAFDFWQRGTSSTSTTGYATADRWYQVRGGAASTHQRISSSLPEGFQYSMRVQRNSGNTSTDGIAINQVWETQDSIPFQGQAVTLSFWAKCGANFSPTSSALAVRLYTGTGTDQAAGAFGTWTGYAEPLAPNPVLTTSWQRFTYTGTIGATATQIGLVMYLFGQGTAGANDWFEVTGIQIERGSVATAFRRAGATLAGELAACRRYLPAVRGGTGTAAGGYIGYAYGTNTTIYVIPFDVPARVSPTGITVSGTIRAFALNVGTTVTPTFNSASVNSSYILATPTITAGQGSRLDMDTDSLILFTGCEL